MSLLESASHSKPAPGTQAAAFDMLINAIGSLLSPVIQQLLNSDPSLVHFRGWHGMTPLHRACLIGDYNIVLMLIQANSDVNALTDFRETPLHYASKHGKPSVVHLLIQCGAQIDFKDNKGRSALHHAAENGAVQVIKYYEEAFGVNMKELDTNLQSPMHIACTHGHLDFFFFLMSKGRSDLRQADSQGNLPIHITSKNGFGHMTWSMLCILGVPVLKQTNKAGLTPLALVLQGDQFGHKELAPVLKYYSNQRENVPVTGSVFMWYFWLLYPAVLYMITVIVSQYFTSYQFFIYLAAIGLVALQTRGISHRMNDVSRWPNPFFAGFFFGGIIHTTICYLWLIYPYFYANLYITVLTWTACPSLYGIYYMLIKRDPGAVTTSAKDPTVGKIMTLTDLCMMRNPPYKFCSVCDFVTNELTKHCRLCNQCYFQMDHHCLFLLKCVASNNHVLFVWLLILATINMFLYCMAFYWYITLLYKDMAYTDLFLEVLHKQAWPFSLLCLNAISAFWSCNLIYIQYQVVTRGCTSYFNDYQAHKYPLTHYQTLNNFLHFLLSKPLPNPNPHSPLVFHREQHHSTPRFNLPQTTSKSDLAEINVV